MKMIFAIVYLLIFAIYLIAYGWLNHVKLHQRKKGNLFGKSFKLIYPVIIMATFVYTAYPTLSFRVLLPQKTIYYCSFVLLIFGTSLFLWAILSLKRNYSPCYDSRIPSNITTEGPYQYIRHPIYSGNILTLLGCFLTSGSVVVITTTFVVFLYYFYASVLEERDLLNVFGQKYQNYQNKTGMFFPKIIQ